MRMRMRWERRCPAPALIPREGPRARAVPGCQAKGSQLCPGATHGTRQTQRESPTAGSARWQGRAGRAAQEEQWARNAPSR